MMALFSTATYNMKGTQIHGEACEGPAGKPSDAIQYIPEGVEHKHSTLGTKFDPEKQPLTPELEAKGITQEDYEAICELLRKGFGATGMDSGFSKAIMKANEAYFEKIGCIACYAEYNKGCKAMVVYTKEVADAGAVEFGQGMGSSGLGSGMFMWWQEIFGQPVTVKEQHDDDALAIMDETQKEIADMNEIVSSSTLSRPSPVAKSKYNRWAVADYNRQIGDEGRAHWATLDAQRKTDKAEFLEAGHERAEAAREQREAALERVRQHKADMAARGSNVKQDVDQFKQTALDLRAKTIANGAQLAQIYGAEQKDRILESKTERFEELRQIATHHKDGEAERAAIFAAAAERELEEKRQRVARIRAETQPDVARQSKAYFFSMRKKVADDVRDSVRDWAHEKAFNSAVAKKRAEENRDGAYNSRRAAADGKAAVHTERHQDANAMRMNIQAIADKKMHAKLSDAIAKRDAHDNTYEEKYVTETEADSVVTSSYDQLASKHQQELKEGKPGRIIGKPGLISE